MCVRKNIPDAMWFCFFSSSVSRGLSSPAPSRLPAEGDLLLLGEDMSANLWMSEEQCSVQSKEVMAVLVLMLM